MRGLGDYSPRGSSRRHGPCGPSSGSARDPAICASGAAVTMPPVTDGRSRLPRSRWRCRSRRSQATSAADAAREARSPCPGNSPATSAALAVDLQTDGVVFARHADLSLAPASNEKLAVTFAALRELGPRTASDRGARPGRSGRDGVWHGDLVLKGFGDPTLTSARLGRARARDRATAGSRASTGACSATRRGSTGRAAPAGRRRSSSTSRRRSRRSSSTARCTTVTSRRAGARRASATFRTRCCAASA